MKINSELERVLLMEQAQGRNPVPIDNSTSKTFGSLLDSELNATNELNGMTSSIAGMSTSSLNATQVGLQTVQNSTVSTTTSQSTADSQIEASLVQGIDRALIGMDAYSASISASRQNLFGENSATLKQAWTNLSTVSQDVGAMQKDFASLSRRNPSIGSMLNDLEVMTVTETYKFNRGDYL